MYKGHKLSYDFLYKSKFDKMVNIAYRTLGCMESAEDMVQETFFRALKSWNKVTEHPEPELWLIKTLTYLTNNEKKRHSNFAELPLDYFEGMADGQEEPLEYVLPKQMSEKDKQILIWRFEKRLDYRQMADLLGISESACRSRLSRAMKRYRDLVVKK